MKSRAEVVLAAWTGIVGWHLGDLEDVAGLLPSIRWLP